MSDLVKALVMKAFETVTNRFVIRITVSVQLLGHSQLSKNTFHISVMRKARIIYG